MSKVKLLTQKEYAEHRGCSPVAVHKAVKAGRISLIDGRIDPDVADIQWARNTRARISAKAQTAPGAADTLVAAGESGDLLAVDAVVTVAPAEEARPGDEGYWTFRTRRERAEAAMAERRDAEEAGDLIRVAAVSTMLAHAYITTREAVLNMAARLAPKLAVESDTAAIQNLLHAELHAALTQLAAASAAYPSADQPGEAQADA